MECGHDHTVFKRTGAKTIISRFNKNNRRFICHILLFGSYLQVRKQIKAVLGRFD